MKVFFLPKTAQYVPRLAQDFQPGNIEVSAEHGAFLIRAGLAVSEAPTFQAPAEVEAAAVEAMATDEKGRGFFRGKGKGE